MAATQEQDKRNTEARILAAAERIFLRVGFAGARMQHIADEAGINKALLHYYFRNKEQLYQRVFDAAYQKFAIALAKLDQQELSLTEKIEQFVIEVWKLTSENTALLSFLATEISRSMPVIVSTRFRLADLHLTKQLQDAMARGEIQRAEPLPVVLQLFSLCFYPLQSGPMLTSLLEVPEYEYKASLRAYYERIPSLIISTLRK